jgi:replication factor C subunit 2/4
MDKIPWIEKYRPKTISELVIDPSISNKIHKIVQERDMPNIIITGLPGIGKTTTIMCLARALLGKYEKEGVLDLNASDDRGIKAIQETINFCKKKIDINEDDKIKYAEHKIILLDEADNMTNKAQRLVNNLMGKYHKTTRFAFTCNNSSDIIEAIQSRCIIFRYFRLTLKQLTQRLQEIAVMENVKFDLGALQEIAAASQGDMRQAINKLQVIHNSYSVVNIENLAKLCDKPHPVIIRNIFLSCKNKKIREALLAIQELKNKGYSGSDIVLAMITFLKSYTNLDLPEPLKINYLDKIGKTAYIVSKGIDSQLQLTGCICSMCM